MKKQLLSAILCASMVAGTFAGAGAVMADDAAAEGSVLNVKVWNTEFISRVTDHYPGYEKVDDTTGKIGDVTVNWQITANEGNAYQDNLDQALLAQADAAPDDKVDMFLIEADYALKYVNAETPVAMSMEELGITEDDLSKQYEYTKDVVRDANGVQRASSWQTAASGLIFNREAAKEVLGTDDLDAVQEAVKDWDTFNETAAKMKEAGYKMTASANDTYRVYSNNVTKKWVEDGQIQIDDNIMKWVEDSKALVDAEETGTFDLWSDDWSKGFYPEGKVFCYFGPAWFFNFCLAADDEGSIAHNGGWGFVNGPQGFNWGGTWICGAVGTDNPTLVKDIILAMTTDNDIMKEIAQKDTDCVNNREVLAELAADDSGNVALLGGQNPYGVLSAGAELIDMKNISSYDQGCNEKFQQVMKGYFDGTSTLEEALAQFDSEVKTLYPALA
jgi:hypothetical protein